VAISLGLGRGGRLALVAEAMIGAGAGWLGRDFIGTAGADEDVLALARTQVDRFYQGTSGKLPLADVLGEAFQLMRTDGSRADRAEYIAKPPAIQTYTLTDFKAVRTGDVLTVTFFAGLTGSVQGIERNSSGQPRLAVFTKVDGEWKLQAFANLGQGLGANADAEARKVVAEWVQAVGSGDKAVVEAMLAPEFQIVRADGATYTVADYVKDGLPTIAKAPEIDRLMGTRYGDYLVVRYWLKLDATVGGAAMERLAPRLTVFRKSGDKWLVVAHSNFAPIK
jgi:ketosteroid isomerase-like protein